MTDYEGRQVTMRLLQNVCTGVLSLKWYELILCLLLAIVLYFVIISVYRITLHPLAKYPGPLLQSISDWPLVIHCYRGDRHLWEYKNHLKYGPIVRYGANSLSISSPEALQAIHSSKANIKKGDWYKTLDISAGAPSVQMEIDKQQHAMRRRFLSPAFSERALKEAERLITVSAIKLTEGLSKLPEGAQKGDWAPSHNMGRWATFFGFDFISDLGYGQSFGMLEHDGNRWVPDVLKNASIFIYYVGYLPFIDLVRPLMGSCIQDYIGGQEAADSLKYTKLANTRLAERVDLEKQYKDRGKAVSEQRKDTFHYLLNSKDPITGKGFTTEQLQADSALIIAAGSDGVGLTLSATFFYLLAYPATLEKLTAEIRAAFSSASEIANPKLNSLPYLHACIEETLRMNPPKPSSLPRQVLKGGVRVGDASFPAGVTLGVPLYVLHHDAAYFPRPWEYVPERWIVDEKAGVGAEDVVRARSAYAPFLIGPMNCIGKNMSYIALKLAIAHLLWRCDVRKAGELTGGGAEGEEDEGRRRWNEYQMRDWILGFRDGPQIEVRERV